MLKKKLMVWLGAILGVGCLFAVPVTADTVFQSDFTGTTGEQIASLPEWSNGFVQSGATQTIEDNMGKLYGPATGWIYSSIRADKSEGVAQNFDPINSTGNRFENTVVKASSTDTTYAAMYRMWVGPQASTSSGVYNTLGQHIWFDLTWNKTTNAITLELRQAVNVGVQNTGALVYSFTKPTVDLDAGESIRLALEVRDDAAGDDARVAYQTYKSGAWGEWVTSAWFDPTDAAYGANAFAADWKTTWDNNTYFYLEQNSRTSYARSVYVDDVLVTGVVPEPATMVLISLGSLGLILRKKMVK